MAKATFFLFLMAFALVASAAQDPVIQRLNVDQLTSLIASSNGKTDSELAQELAPLQLTERLSADKLTGMEPSLPGQKSKDQLLILADSAAFLDLPSAQMPQKATPDAAALRQMLVKMVNYLNSTLHQLPNFVAKRQTLAFEDRPEENVQEPTAVVYLSYLPLHFVGQSSVDVAYRDGHDTVLTKQKAAQHEAQVHGLLTAGDFGPFPRTVLSDAIRGKIIWGHWEQRSGGTEAVFRYSVPKSDSHYVVQFCCVTGDEDVSVATNIYSARAGYHGEIAFDPATGSVLRITLQADLDAGELVASAGVAVEYGPEQIGAQTVVLPTKSITLMQAHTTHSRDGMTHPTFTGKTKTFLNDTSFTDYREYRGEIRILTGENAAPPRE
jgi:hypothetical protein